jgi:hypothetical protein
MSTNIEENLHDHHYLSKLHFQCNLSNFGKGKEVTMSSYYDKVLERQVEQFNQHLGDAASFHKQTLKLLCADRIIKELEDIRDRPVRIRSIQPRQFRARAIIGSALQQASNARKWVGRRIGNALARRGTYPSQVSIHSDLIEAEYAVISNLSTVSDETITINKEEE